MINETLNFKCDIEGFDWDPVKNMSNLKKHGIRFEDATKVFYDDMLVTFDDDRSDYRELRVINIGFTMAGILCVVSVERDLEDGQETTRIISARKADKDEMNQWRNNNGFK